MSVRDNRISAVHKTGRHMLRADARLAAWAVARQFDITSDQLDAIVDAALDAVIGRLEQWEQGKGTVK